jgi:hypothetical protein
MATTGSTDRRECATWKQLGPVNPGATLAYEARDALTAKLTPSTPVPGAMRGSVPPVAPRLRDHPKGVALMARRSRGGLGQAGRYGD